jgi:hypothetical protein
VDDNISSTIHRAPKTQKTVIRARKIPFLRARVDALVDEKTDARVWHRRVEKMKDRVGRAMCGWNERVLERLLNSKNGNFCNQLFS